MPIIHTTPALPTIAAINNVYNKKDNIKFNSAV